MTRLTLLGALLGAPAQARDTTLERYGVSSYYLALDQGMVTAAIGNALTSDKLRSYLTPALERRVRPLLAMEEFSIR